MPTQENRIEIVAYDTGWPAAFEAEAARLRAALQGLALRIDHHGSTAIPGLGAKPIIDIQISVATLQPLSMYARSSTRLDTFTCRILTTRFVRSSIGQSGGRTVTTCMSSKGAGARNDEHWHFATTFETIPPWRASTNSSNAGSPSKSGRPIPGRKNGMLRPRPSSSNGSSPSRSRGDIQQTCQADSACSRRRLERS